MASQDACFCPSPVNAMSRCLVLMETCSIRTSALSPRYEMKQNQWKEIMYPYSNSFQPVFLRDLYVRKKMLVYELKMCSSGCILCEAMIVESGIGRGHCLLSSLWSSPMRSSISRAVCVGVLPSVQLVLCSPAVSLLYLSIWRITLASSLPAALLSCGNLRESRKLPYSSESL